MFGLLNGRRRLAAAELNSHSDERVCAVATLMKGNPEVFLVIPLYRLAQKVVSEARPPSLQDCGAEGWL